MGKNLFKVERKKDLVLPSGVKATIRGLEGRHQEMLTVQDEKQRMQGFKTMLWECIVQLGNSSSLTEDYINKLTSFDQKFILWEIRKLSNEDKPTFVFDYEFPAKEGKKLKERFEIEFNEKSFPVVPAKWVREKMYFDYKSVLGISGELIEEQKEEAINMPYPVMYDTYDDMLEAHKEVFFTLPACGVEVFWHLATGEDEEKLSKIKNYKSTSSTQFHLRTPKYKDFELGKDASKPIIQAVPLGDLCNEDIEALRGDIMTTEGKVDSLIVVQSTKDPSLITQLDLLRTPAFFFASLAL